MNGWIAWAGTVCMAAAGCAALHMLVGDKGMGKPFRLVTAAFFLCAVLLPLLDLKGEISFSQQSAEIVGAEELEDIALRQMTEMTQDILLAEVNQALSGYALEAERAEIQMDSSADGSISISKIVLYIPPQSSLHQSWVKQIAEKRLGTEVEVRYAE